MRQWDKFSNNEIASIWNGFINYEENSFLRASQEPIKPLRITFLEIVHLVGELLKRLKDEEDGK